MKSYSVGRDESCNIVINDPQNLVSRYHAVINVGPGNKMTIIDQSTNGTYVNGMRIATNVPVPVTRKDKVSLAHSVDLDWAAIPSSGSPAWIKYLALGVGAAVIVGAVVWGGMMILSPGADDSASFGAGSPTTTDSVSAPSKPGNAKEQIKEDETTKSMDLQEADSLVRARQEMERERARRAAEQRKQKAEAAKTNSKPAEAAKTDSKPNADKPATSEPKKEAPKKEAPKKDKENNNTKPDNDKKDNPKPEEPQKTDTPEMPMF